MDGQADGIEALHGNRDGERAQHESEDERAREMIARIARQVDLEMGRLPLEPREEASSEVDRADGAEDAVVPIAEAPPARTEEPAERSEEDVARDLIERIAREVDEESHG